MSKTPNRNPIVPPVGLDLQAMLAEYDRRDAVIEAVKKDVSSMRLPPRTLDGLVAASVMCGKACGKNVTASSKCGDGPTTHTC